MVGYYKCRRARETIVDGLRRTALAIHGLVKSDQAWVLSHLPVTTSEQVKVLLAELESLGIPRDPKLSNPQLGEVAEQIVTDTVFDHIDRAELQHIQLLLKAEDDVVIADFFERSRLDLETTFP